MAESNKPVVAFLGPKASYTHQATLDAFNDEEYILSPQITIEDVFAAVQDGSAYRGVVPFENSSNGSVVFTLDLFADLNSKYPDILVCGESYISVQHCLLGHNPKAGAELSPTPNLHTGRTILEGVIESPPSSGAATPTTRDPLPDKPRTAPLGDISRIRKLYSHPQAWGQCKSFLNTYLKGVERQDVSSTSRAAELVAQDALGTSAAISSLIAARVHGLHVLAKGIEDRSDNTTRFFVIKRRTTEAASAFAPPSTTPSAAANSKSPGTRLQEQEPKPAEEDAQKNDAENIHWKSLISFTVDHANPGALAHSLSVFSTYNLNLTSINTRPSGVENWNYIFFVEIRGRRLEGNHEHGAVNSALRDLDRVCRGWRWLGSWEGR